MTKYASTASGESVRAALAAAPCACARSGVAPNQAKPMLSAPPCSSVRREKRGSKFMSASLSAGGHHGLHHAHMRAAAAEIAVKLAAHLVVGRFGHAGQQAGRTHDPAVGAITAL